MDERIVRWLDERWITVEQLEQVKAIVYEDCIKFPVLSPSNHWVFDMIRNFDTSKPRYVIQPTKCRAGHTLYGYSTQKALISSLGLVIVTEGIADSLAVRRLGLPAVAALGSVLSDVQKALLRCSGVYVIVWGDGDTEGKLFAQSVPEFTGVMVQGYDPAAYLASGKGTFSIPPGSDFAKMFISDRTCHHMFFEPDGRLLEMKLRANVDKEFV